MITYINAKNAAKYQILFDQATKDLQADYEAHPDKYQGITNKTDLEIGNLEQYFDQLSNLLSLGQFAGESESVYDRLHSLGRRYSMLPLSNEDEEIFQINANTREITVPAAFKTNGVGVKDDQLAEILYFTIDRFFDITDLDTTEIYIQWESPKGIVGLSKPWVVDIYTDPEKITFGWAISNEMTDGAGNLKFSVRFVKLYDNEHFAFSLGTLQQTVVVKPTLDIDFFKTGVKEVEEMILYRVQNSNTWVTGRDSAKEPFFIIDLPQVADLVNGELVVKAQAGAEDGGTLSYVWYKMALSGYEGEAQLGDLSNLDIEGLVSIGYEKTKDLIAVAGKEYFIPILEEDQITGYKRIGSFLDAGENDIYEKVALFKAHLMNIPCGTYKVVATNKKTSLNAASTDSRLCIIPLPTEPVIDQDLPERVVFDKPEASVTSLHIVASNDADKIVVIGDGLTAASVAGELSYKWFKDNVAIKNAVADTLDLTQPIELEGKDAAETSVEGVYTVKVINTKNKAVKELASPVSCRVSLMPVMPQINGVQVKINGIVTEQTALYDYSIQDTDVIELEVLVNAPTDLNAEDSFTYQWKSTPDATPDYDPTDDDQNDIEITGATEKTYQFNGSEMPDTGRYYCVVSYTKNNETITDNSGLVRLNK